MQKSCRVRGRETPTLKSVQDRATSRGFPGREEAVA